MENVIVLGASNDTSKYAYKAVDLLIKHKHHPIPVHPTEPNLVLGKKVYQTLADVLNDNLKIDTITMYVNPRISEGMAEDIIKIKPQRVIFNPGSENLELAKKLNAAGIKTENACTLVLLHTGQY